MRPQVHTLALIFAMGCSNPIVLGSPEPTGEPDAEPSPVPDAGVDAVAPLTDAALPTRTNDSVCGFQFEQRASAYTHVWASSPTNLWLVRDHEEVYRSDGRALTHVPLPESATAGRYRIHRLEGVGRHGPWLLVGRHVGSYSLQFSLLWWNEGRWESLELPTELERPHDQTFDELVVLGHDDIWAASEDTGHVSRATLFHWNGSRWSSHVFDGSWPFGLGAVGDGEVAFALRRRGETPAVLLHQGSVSGWRPLEPEPRYITTGAGQPVVFHASHRDTELVVDAVGRVWNSGSWQWTHRSEGDDYAARWGHGLSHHSVLGVGHYNGAFWIVKKRVAVRIGDPNHPEDYEVFVLPFEATDVTFPSEGPPWVVGPSRAFWNGVRWEIQGETTRPLYEGFNNVWGTAADDYWLSTQEGVVHVHDGISEHRLGPPECGDAPITGVFALADDDLFFNTCNGVQRHYRGRWRDIVLDSWGSGRRVIVWGVDEARLWAFERNHAHRFEYDRFELEGAEAWAPASPLPRRWMPLATASDDDSLYVGMDDGEHYRVARFYDGEWSALPPLSGTETGPDNRPWFMRLHTDGTRLWAVGYEGTEPMYSHTRVWSWDGDTWRHDDLPHRDTTGAWMRTLGGRGDDLWVVAQDRTIWRHRPSGEWDRDDRCVHAPQLSGVSFQGVWFPPDGGSPKVFASGGNILVYDEELR